MRTELRQEDDRSMHYRDRADGGRRLAEELAPLAAQGPVVVALPRGGVPVGVEVARALAAPLEILAVRKIGAPGNPELAVGAVAEDGSGVLDQRSADMLGMTQAMLDATLERESLELRRRVARYRQGRAPMDLGGRAVIVVDDGMATGMTDLAAVRALRKRGATPIVVAVPVASVEAVATLEEEADRVVCPSVPRRLYGVGMWYRDFAPVSDEEVLQLLAQAQGQATAPEQVPAAGAAAGAAGDEAQGAAGGEPPGSEPTPASGGEELELTLAGTGLPATLILPGSPRGLVLFAHGSGSSRLSPRNRAVAQALRGAGLAALLFDLLDEREARQRELAFDIALLGARLETATSEIRSDERVHSLPLGYFGASTGAAAALVAAAALPDSVAAVVSRGGRPDLAGDRLTQVQAPTLLIVGGEDVQVLELNRRAATALRCRHELVVVEGATHLFEEPGALERVSELAIGWFQQHLA
jgi:predicted phosphoribosyltransferase/pimeloyl-ACP methyl ester carboxylesterase